MGVKLPGDREEGALFLRSDVRSTATSAQTVQEQVAPIGSVIAWLKSFANTPQTLPEGWVECDGSVLSDGESLYNGETLPDLNGGEFLRGAATSGGTGGSATMAHTHTGPNHNHRLPLSNNGTDFQFNDTPIFGTGSSITTDRKIASTAQADETSSWLSDNAGTGNTGAASNTENRPPYYDIVWIMRIK